MNSKVLPQALLVIPRNPTHCPAPRKLGFSTTFWRGSSLCYSSPHVSASPISTRSFGTNLETIISALARQRIVVRAESEESGTGELDAVAESVEPDAGEAGVEAEMDVEAEQEQITEVKEPWKPRIKLGDVMGILNKRAVEASETERPIPDIRTGDIVEIKLEVPENRRRLSIYKGIVISRQNAGIHTTIRIRRIIAGVGVEIVFPLYSPNIKEIRVLKHRKVRRARLYYLREKLPRLSTFK